MIHDYDLNFDKSLRKFFGELGKVLLDFGYGLSVNTPWNKDGSYKTSFHKFNQGMKENNQDYVKLYSELHTLKRELNKLKREKDEKKAPRIFGMIYR